MQNWVKFRPYFHTQSTTSQDFNKASGEKKLINFQAEAKLFFNIKETRAWILCSADAVWWESGDFFLIRVVTATMIANYAQRLLFLVLTLYVFDSCQGIFGRN